MQRAEMKKAGVHAASPPETGKDDDDNAYRQALLCSFHKPEVRNTPDFPA
jgi:hypothetical protein